jgi:hypothetical protein
MTRARRGEVDDNAFPCAALIGIFAHANMRDLCRLRVDGRIGRLNLSAQAYGAFGWTRTTSSRTKPARSDYFFAASRLDTWTSSASARVPLRERDGNPHNDVEVVSTPFSRTRSCR